MNYRFFITAVFILCLSATADAQYTVTLQGGLTHLLLKKDGQTESFMDNFKSRSLILTVSRQYTKSINAGVSLLYQLRKFNYSYWPSVKGNIFEDLHTSHYLYLGATGDIAVDKKKMLHFALMPAFGVLIAGKEKHYLGKATYGADYTSDNTHLSKTDFRMGAQFYVRFPAGRHYFVLPGIMYNFGFSSLTDLRPIRPADVTLQIGVSRIF